MSVDACATERRTRSCLEATRGVTDRPVRTLINTHHHGDHTLASCLFDATVVAHEQTRVELLKAGVWRSSIRGAATSVETVSRAQQLVALIGKQSVVVRDVPGFATSRLDVVAALEAMRMVESEVAAGELGQKSGRGFFDWP